MMKNLLTVVSSFSGRRSNVSGVCDVNIVQRYSAIGGAAILLLMGACSSEGSDDEPGGEAGGGSAMTGGNGAGGGEQPASGGASGGGAAPAVGGGDGGSAPNVGGNFQGIGGSSSGGAPAAGGSGSEEVYPPFAGADEDGADLWLRFPELPIELRLGEYRAAFADGIANENGDDSATLELAESELAAGLSGLTGETISAGVEPGGASVVIGTPESSEVIAALSLAAELPALGPDGYTIQAAQTADGVDVIAIAANTDVGVLYGSYALLRHLQSHSGVINLSLSASPKIEHRILNHWDNLDRSVERGYAGRSLWNWGELPGTLSPRYEEYARANASIGINGTVLTNVNADAEVLTASYITKVAAIADVLRPYGLRVYLTARFSAPIEIGGLSTADPTDAGVQQWWKDKGEEIYASIPDFGGFLVKANSEGQPGPQDYNRSHAEGANTLAAAVEPFGGIVMWRAFVYPDLSSTDPMDPTDPGTSDRIREAYDEFKPLDGQFNANVLVQPKNGPLDFQPREPFSPLFGAMPATPLALELQVTKEYLGQDTHLAYLGTMYEEVLKTDTYADGPGSTVARVIDGSLHNYSTTAIAGVANIGDDTNWTGSQFNQANWYVYGRMAWDPDLTAKAVAEEWVRQTLSNDPNVVVPVVDMMMKSRQALVDYMTPLGLVHIMASTHHYGPGPWVGNLDRPEWNPVYYHEADAAGVGFDRTTSGSNAVAQYFDEVGATYGSRETVPDDLLLFFHHVGWEEEMHSGRNLWEEMVHRYSLGVDQVGEMRDAWATVESAIDGQRFTEITEHLQIQHYEARWWRDACLSYFATFSNQAIPSGYAEPANPLSFYQGLSCPSNRDKPRCPQIETGEPSPAILQ